MDKDTLDALKGSIAKWQRIVLGTGADYGSTNCPLCEMYIFKGCHGCPVSNFTSVSGCENTPYADWVEVHQYREPVPIGYGKEIYDARSRTIAEREVAFLISLLPPGEAPP